VDKKRDKLERKVLDSQERAFWDVHRPAVSALYIVKLTNITQCKLIKCRPHHCKACPVVVGLKLFLSMVNTFEIQI